ncbi:hypothetical protein DK459_11710 [Achromobacter sp. RW408]|uniref:hypothetical protein n=1 Tax=Achromobacter sp. RW408 TaxID=2202897 RepID=UPI000D73AB61|nr:hypothetical protein [Achromobacter sp. RW408]PWY49186.1 hypothetical protein DK459_11710 [Achromobacter sp. RW408]
MNEQNNIAQPAIVVTLTRTLGAYGAAFDLPGPHRAFTYRHQPGNIGAHRLGAAWQKAASGSSGDLIDRGLGLLQALQEVGFGVFEVSEIAAPVAEERAACPTDVCKAGQADAVLCANDECDRANGVRPPMYRIPGVREDVLRRAALASAPVACNCPGGNKPVDLHAPNCPVRTAKATLIDPYDGGTWLASTPVAGEAVTWEAVRQELAIFLMGATGRSSKEWHRPLDNASEGGALARMRACLAAPQASAEDVRNAALEEAAKLMDQTLRSNGAALIRGLKRSQADKDGGQQRAGDGKPREAVDYPRGGALNFDDPVSASAEGIRSPSNACMHRHECRAMLERQTAARNTRLRDLAAEALTWMESSTEKPVSLCADLRTVLTSSNSRNSQGGIDG